MLDRKVVYAHLKWRRCKMVDPVLAHAPVIVLLLAACPTVHERHFAAGSSFLPWYVPLAQGRQAAVLFTNSVPFSQNKQSSARTWSELSVPGSVRTRPGAHAAHDTFAVVLLAWYCPAPHVAQSEVALTKRVPLRQCRQGA